MVATCSLLIIIIRVKERYIYTRADARLVVVSMVQLLYLPFEGFKLAAVEYKERLTITKDPSHSRAKGS